MSAQENQAKILILATEDCAYPGANATGQAHMSYPDNTYILKVRAPVMFPEKFYMDCFKKGIYGIIIMSCGVECAYEGAYPALAARMEKLYPMMKEQGLDTRRVRLTGVCTVCSQSLCERSKPDESAPG